LLYRAINGENDMIRFLIGFLLVLGSVGGIDNAGPEQSLVPMLATAVLGLALMAWGQAKGKAFGN
jgi:hypothetical protein